MKRKICQNCKKEYQYLKDIYLFDTKEHEKWCYTCRKNYEKDTKIILTRGIR